jgi:hypothetical protein
MTNPPSKTANGGISYGRGLRRLEMRGNGCVPSDEWTSGRNPAAGGGGCGAPRCGRRGPSTAGNGGGGGGVAARLRSESAGGLAEQPGSAAEAGGAVGDFRSGGGERVGVC